MIKGRLRGRRVRYNSVKMVWESENGIKKNRKVQRIKVLLKSKLVCCRQWWIFQELILSIWK